MLFYYLFIIFLIFFSGRWNIIPGKYLANKNRRLEYSFLILTLFACCRFNIGFDWNIYLSKVYPSFSYHRIERFEPLNKLIFLIAMIFKSPWLYFALYAVITYFLVYKSIKENSYNYYESIIIYVSLFYLSSLSTLRQAVALSIVLYGFKYIRDKSLYKYILCCITATLFHKTAIISILSYFIYWINPYVYVSFISIFAITFKKILTIALGAFSEYYIAYINGEMVGGGNSVKYIYLLLLTYCFVLSFLDNKIRYKECSGLLNNVILGGVMPFLLGAHTGVRLGSYFFIYIVLLIPYLHKNKNKFYKSIFLIFFYLYLFMYLYTTVNASNSTEYVPYRFYFLEQLGQPLE